MTRTIICFGNVDFAKLKGHYITNDCYTPIYAFFLKKNNNALYVAISF